VGSIPITRSKSKKPLIERLFLFNGN